LSRNIGQRSALNKSFFDALKSGGVFLVVDHVGETLHRIDPIRMRREIESGWLRSQTTK
jgi:predicted methyltransferase